MVRSMTGYGRAEGISDGIHVIAEIKSVNSRYLEFNPRIHRAYAFLEDRLKNLIRSVISRGKVDLYLQIENENDTPVSVHLNQGLADGYFQVLQEMIERYHFPEQISISQIASFPDVLTVRKEVVDEEKIWAAVEIVLQKAIENFHQMRLREGEMLCADVMERKDKILDLVSFVEKRSPQTVKEYNDKLLARMREFLDGENVDEQRIVTEAAIFADRVAVAEETVRLRSHFSQLPDILASDEPVGRKLDFLVQEMNREANTIGSKAQDLEIARAVIEMKAEIEKIREQIQNIE